MSALDFIRDAKNKRAFTKFDDDLLKELESLSGRGLTIKQIAGFYGISTRTFHERMVEFPELKAAIRKGKCKTIANVAGHLYEQSKAGITSATIFYLKVIGEWKTQDIERDLEENHKEQPNLTINVTDPIEAAKIYQQIMRGDNEHE